MKRILLLTIFLQTLAGLGYIRAQELKFRVAEFYQDQQDLTGQEENRDDGDGALYAVIKVTSDNEDNDLNDYFFDFNYLKCSKEMRDDELWLFVQRNAKNVTIRREGYKTLKYSLPQTIQAGKTYRMKLSMQQRIVQQRILQFLVNPANNRAIVKVKKEGSNEDYLLWGTVDAQGSIDRLVETGEYLYEISAENFQTSLGKVTIANDRGNYVEKVSLTPNFSKTTIKVQDDAEIFINGTKKGKGSWTGTLHAGTYNVECRLPNHESSQKQIVVKADIPDTFVIEKPHPIEGSLYVKSNPSGAKIFLDGKDLGVVTPSKINNVLVGPHRVTVMFDDKKKDNINIYVKKDDIATLNMKLSDVNTMDATRSADRTFNVGGVTFTMKYVEAGTFLMGSTDYPNEQPIHRVTISKDYYIGETEVTQALWKAVTGYSPTKGSSWEKGYGLGDNYPAYNISYGDVQSFIKKLNKITGVYFRMPTEAEWEFAARGGNKSKGYKYSGSNTIDNVAWYRDNSWFRDNNNSLTHPVKTKAANELGIYDMSGNVSEWCSDWREKYGRSEQTDPTGPTTGTARVIRGGNWGCLDTNCSCTYRNSHTPFMGASLGVRLAL